MNFILLAKTNNFILKPIAWVLSIVIDGLFRLIYMLTSSQSLGITIILFTFIIRAVLMPLSLKQQRSTRKMQRIQPQIQKIQDKYKGKTDPESKNRMSMEMQEIYSKNKTSPFTGCLPLLIQMPILFAMYEIFRNVPFYIDQLGNLYKDMAGIVMNTSNYATVIPDQFGSVLRGVSKFNAESVNSVMDFLSHLTAGEWKEFAEAVKLTGNAGFGAMQAEAHAINNFIGFNLAEAPGIGIPGIIWPLLAGVTTWLQSWLAQRSNEKRQRFNGDTTTSSTQQTMKTMNIIFPIMMAFFVVSSPLGLGLYWVASNLFSIGQQFLMDMILDREDRLDAIRRRDEYAEKKRLQELQKSSIDKRTGKRIGTATVAANRSSLAGNKKAAQQQLRKLEEQKKEELKKTESEESVSSDEEE